MFEQVVLCFNSETFINGRKRRTWECSDFAGFCLLIQMKERFGSDHKDEIAEQKDDVVQNQRDIRSSRLYRYARVWPGKLGTVSWFSQAPRDIVSLMWLVWHRRTRIPALRLFSSGKEAIPHVIEHHRPDKFRWHRTTEGQYDSSNLRFLLRHVPLGPANNGASLAPLLISSVDLCSCPPILPRPWAGEVASTAGWLVPAAGTGPSHTWVGGSRMAKNNNR